MDDQEFRTFYETTKADGYRLAYSYLHNESEAEDVLHDAFLRFYHHQPRDQEKARAYLFSIIVRLSLDRLRSQRKRAVLHDEEKEPASKNDYQLLYEAIDDLGAKDSSIIRLHYFAGLSLQEVAKAAGLSLNAVKKRLERARKALKEKL